MSSPDARTPAALLAAVNSLKVETAAIYQPGYLVKGSTWCNRFLADVTDLLGCPVPFALANRQVAWLAGEEDFDGVSAKALGWRELVGPVRLVVAVDQAERGYPVVLGWANPNPDSHGHVALAVPGPKGKLFIAQAGKSNFSSGPVSKGFGSLPYRLFTHP